MAKENKKLNRLNYVNLSHKSFTCKTGINVVCVTFIKYIIS